MYLICILQQIKFRISEHMFSIAKVYFKTLCLRHILCLSLNNSSSPCANYNQIHKMYVLTEEYLSQIFVFIYIGIFHAVYLVWCSIQFTLSIKCKPVFHAQSKGDRLSHVKQIIHKCINIASSIIYFLNDDEKLETI